MRVLSLKTLREFWELHPDAEPSLRVSDDPLHKEDGKRQFPIQRLSTFACR